MKTKENILIVALGERWEKYRVELKTCKRDFSEEAVHDLRVATRRLLAVMDILRTLDPHPRVQKTRRILKNQLDSLDELRDVQVMLVDISESVANFPDLKPFELRLLAREKKLLREARKLIKALQASELARRVRKIRAELEEKAQDRGFNTRILSVVDQAYSQATQALGQIDPSQSASIHRLRIAFKKFRYMVEIASPLMKKYPVAYLKQMHDYQSKMGDVQDAEVFLNALVDFAGQTAASATLEPARRSFEGQRAELIAAFINDKEALHIFWRKTPDENFSWEKENEPVHHTSRNRGGSGNARIRKRQPAPTDRKREKENAKDSAGTQRLGSGDQLDPDQSVPARRGDGEDSQEDV